MSKEKPSTSDKRRREHIRRAVAAGTLPVVSGDVAGIDIGSREHYVALPPDRGQPVRSFGCFTPELVRLAEFLKEHRIKTVMMEATGVYWVPLFELLEQRGFDVQLVDARHLKNVSGRKSDVQDCEWVQRLGSYGLLRGAFRPKPEIAPLRAYWRQRDGLIKDGARQIQLMQKALEQMNVQLHKAVDDITGLTGLAILDAILDGERDPAVLAQLRDPHVKASQETLRKSLAGNWDPAQIIVLQQRRSLYRSHREQIDEPESRN